MSVTHEMNTTAFRRYLDATGSPFKEAIWSLWLDIRALWPNVPPMMCWQTAMGAMKVSFDTGTRVLELDLWDVEGRVYWTDRDRRETECRCEPTPLWREKFLDRIPWLLEEQG